MEENKVITGRFKATGNPQVKSFLIFTIVVLTLAIGYITYDGITHPEQWRRLFSTPEQATQTYIFLGLIILAIGGNIARVLVSANREVLVQFEKKGDKASLIVPGTPYRFTFPVPFEAGITEETRAGKGSTRCLRLVVSKEMSGSEPVKVVFEEEVPPGVSVSAVSTGAVRIPDKAVRFINAEPEDGALREIVEILRDMKPE